LFSLIRGLARPDFLFMGGIAVLLAFGVVTPAQAFAGFSNQAVFTVGALFVIAAGIQKTRALSFIERRIFDDHSSPRFILIKMMGSTALMSAFLNNTPIVAMLVPQVQEWAERSGNAASRLLIPLSYAAISGGVITLIGTSTNLIVSGMLAERGMSPLGFFELSWIGLPAAIMVFLYFSTIGYKRLPEHQRNGKKAGSSSLSDVYQFDLRIPEGSELHKLSVDEAGLRALDDVFLIHVRRYNQILGPIGPQFLLEEGDILTFSGQFDAVEKLSIRKGLERDVPVLDAKTKDLPIYEAVVAPSSPLVGKTLKEYEFREQYRGVVVGIQRRNETLRGALGQIPIKAGDLLLIEAKPGFRDKWNSAKDEFYLVTERGTRDLPADEKAPLALLTLLAVVLPAALGLVPIVTTAFIGAIVMLLSGCVNRSQLFTSLNLPILIVIAAAIGIGQAMEASGLAEAGARLMLQGTAASGLGVIALIVAIYITTNILTEIITNNAAAVLMIPLALSAALSTGMPPHAAAVTVAVAASASFLTPIGYQTNLMVMSAGGYSFKDYFKAGLPVTLIFLATTVGVVYWRFV
jgi:di/tricarboxylate transporter